MIIKFFTIVTIVTLLGCSNEYQETEKAFMYGCTDIGGRDSASLCKCTFKKIKNKYSAEELKKINRGQISRQDMDIYSEIVVDSAMQCRN